MISPEIDAYKAYRIEECKEEMHPLAIPMPSEFLSK